MSRDDQSARCLILIHARGGKLIDDILLDLLDRGINGASVVDVQSVGEAMTHEVPLFVDFRDLFGDPAGRRLILIETETDRAETVAQIVRGNCARHPHAGAHLTVVPVVASHSFGQLDVKAPGAGPP